MANTIQIKRSAGSSAPGASDLSKGELAWVDHGTGGGDGVLYIGDMTAAGASVRTIGGTSGSSYISDILTSTALTGVPTAPTAAVDTSTTQLATTAFVQNQITANQNPISQAGDTNISGPSAAEMLIFNGGDSKWHNKSLAGDVTIDANGNTTVGSVGVNSVQLGTDTTGNYISTITGTPNEVEVSANGVEQAAVTIGLPNDVTITGNLTVKGQTTTVESTVVEVTDPVFTVGQDGSDDNLDRGIQFKYNNGGAKTGFFGMDDSDHTFKYWADATNTSEVFSGTLGNAAFGDIEGTLTTVAQPNITTLGTITGGTWQGNAIDSTRGGMGIDTSGETGVAKVDGGTWSVVSEMPVALGGTGHQTVAQHAILVGDGTNDMTVLAAGAAGQKLAISAGGAPEWSDSIDGGTW